jgi:lysophospholipase L1-like esterase
VSWLLARILLGLRLLAALGMVSCATIATRSGCGGDRAVVPLPQAKRAWIVRHEEKVAEAKRRAGQVDLLFVGDSITQNYERTSAEEFSNFRPLWDELFGPHRAMNLGFDGDRTYNVLWRLRHGEADGLQPKDVVVLIGTNNFFRSNMEPHGETPQQVTAGTLAIVEELHTRMPEARVLVLSILPTGFGAEWMLKIDAVNAQVQAAVTKLAYARYLDVSGSFLDGKRVRDELYYEGRLSPAERALHPTVAGQRSMAEAVARELYGR